MPLTHARTHAWRIDDREYARHELRRGRRYAYEVLDPARTALVVVDLVEFFVRENPYAAGTVPVVNRLAHALRSAGGTVVSTFGDVRSSEEVLALLAGPGVDDEP